MGLSTHPVAHARNEPNATKRERNIMMNNKCIALAVILALAVACMPAQVEAQTKEQWATFLTELYVKDQFLNAAGLGNDWTSWAGTPQGRMGRLGLCLQLGHSLPRRKTLDGSR